MMCIVLCPTIVHYVLSCHDPVSPHHRCVIMHEVVDESLRKNMSLSTECAVGSLSFRCPCFVVNNIAWSWQEYHFSSSSCSDLLLLRAEPEVDGWQRHLKSLRCGRNFTNIISYVSSCQRMPFLWNVKFTWIVKGPIYFYVKRPLLLSLPPSF